MEFQDWIPTITGLLTVAGAVLLAGRWIMDAVKKIETVPVHTERLEKLDQGQLEILHKVGEVASSVDANASHQTQLVLGVEGKVTDLTTTVASLDSKVDSIDVRVATVEGKLAPRDQLDVERRSPERRRDTGPQRR